RPTVFAPDELVESGIGNTCDVADSCPRKVEDMEEQGADGATMGHHRDELIGMSLPERLQGAHHSRRERRERFSSAARYVFPRGDSLPLRFEALLDFITAKSRP